MQQPKEVQRRFGRRGVARAVLLALLFSFASVGSSEAVPPLINFQGILTDSAGNPLTGTYGVTFSIWDTGPGTTGGDELWYETQSVAVSSGLFSVTLGTNTAIPSSIFASSSTWLQMLVSGDSSPISPRKQLASAPYAMDAAMVDTEAITNGMLAPLSVTDSKVNDVSVGKITGSEDSPSFISGLTPSKIDSGELPSDVVASSLAVTSVYPAAVATGTYSQITLPSTNLSGLVPDADLDSSSVTLQGNAFNAAGELVQLDAYGHLPATAFNGSAALLASSQTFTGSPTFASSVTFNGTVGLADGASAGGNRLTNVGAPSAQTDAATLGTVNAATAAAVTEAVYLATSSVADLEVTGSTNMFTAEQTFANTATFQSSVTVNAAALFSAGLSAGGDRITGVGAPEAPSDAATLGSVNTATAAAVAEAVYLATSAVENSQVTETTNVFTAEQTFANTATFNSSVTVNGNLGATGNLTAATLSGGGSGLTSLTPGNLAAGALPANVVASSDAVGSVYPAAVEAGTYNTITLPSSNLSGLIPDADLDSSSVTLQGNAFNAAGQLVKLDSGGHLPSSVFNGSAALLASSQTFTGSPTFASSATFNGAVGLNDGASAGGNRLTNVGSPSALTDAATLGTVNAATAAAVAQAVSIATNALTSQLVTGSSNVFTAEQTFANPATFVSSVTVNGNVGTTGSVSAGSFNGSGAGLVNLNAFNITNGILAPGVLPSTVAFTSSPGTFTSSQTFTGGMSAGGRSINNVANPALGTDAVNLETLNIATASAVADAVYLATSSFSGGAGWQSSSNTFTAEQTFDNTATFNSSVTVNSVLGATTETVANSLTVGEGVTALSFSGNGAALTNLNASNIMEGSLGATAGELTVNLSSLAYTGQLPAEYVQFTGAAALLASSQTFTGLDTFANPATFNSSVTVSGTLGATDVTGNGSGLTDLAAGNIAANGTFLAENGSALTNLTAGNIASGGTFLAENASALTSINASNVTAGSLGATAGEVTVNLSSLTYTGKLPAQYVEFSGTAALLASSQTFTGLDTFANPATFESSVTVNGALGATSVTGNGSGLTSLAAGNIAANGTFLAENAAALMNLNASNVSAGSLGATAGDVTVNLSSLSYTGKLPAEYVQFNGAAALLASSQTFTGLDTFSNPATFNSSVTVNGALGAASFTGNGSGLTALAAGSISSGGTFLSENGSALTNLNASALTSGALGATGGELTVNLSSLSYTGQLPAQYIQFTGAAALLASTQTFTGSDTFSNPATFDSSVTVNGTLGAISVTGNGAGLTGVTASAIAAANVTAGTFGAGVDLPAANLVSGGTLPSENGSALTNLSASNIGAGSLGATAGEVTVNLSSLSYTGQLPAQYVQFSGAAALLASTQTFTGSNTFSNPATFNSSVTVNGTLGATSLIGNGSGLTALTAGNISPGGTFQAENGSALTSLNASALTSGALGATAGQVTVNLSSLSYTGQLPAQYIQFTGSAALLSSSQTFTGLDTFVNPATFDSSVTVNGTLGATNVSGNGSALTNLNAGALASGVVGTPELPATVAYTNVGNTFVAAQTISGSSLTVNGADAGTGYSLSLSSGINAPNGTLTVGQLASDGGFITSDGAGSLTAVHFVGDGSELTGITAGAFSGDINTAQINAGTLPTNVIASSIAVNAVYPAAVAAGTYSNITLPGGNVSGNINGDAANITGNLAATQVASGKLGSGVIASSIAVNSITNANQFSNSALAGALTFSSSATFTASGASQFSIQTSSGIDVSTGILIVGRGANISTITPNGFIGNGSGLTGITASAIAAGNVTAGTFISGVDLPVANLVSGGTLPSENGSALTSLNAGALVSGTVGSGVLPSTVDYTTVNATVSGVKTFTSSATFTAAGASQFSIQTSSGINVSTGILIVGQGANISTVTPYGFIGNGAGLTNITATSFSGNISANQITSGGTFPAENGSALTNLPAGALTSGTVASGVLPSTVAYTSITNAFTAAQQFGAGAAVSTLTATGNLQLVSGSTISARGTLTISTAASASLTGLPAIFVNSGGDVGLGTSNPGNKLTVLNGNIQISTTSGSNGIVFQDGTTLTSAASINPWTTAGSNIYNANAGDVGIGTASPQTLMDVNGSAQFGSGVAKSTFTSTGNLQLVSGSTISANGTLSISTAASASLTGTPAILINSSGYVGIGTNSPGWPLNVYGNAALGGVGEFETAGETQIELRSLASSEQNMYISFASWSNSQSGLRQMGVIGFGAGGNMLFDTTNDGAISSTERMRITGTGSIGMGTSSPQSALDVNGGISIGSYAGSNAAPSNGAIISGNVGIGTSAPIQLLDVNGGVNLRSNLTVASSASFNAAGAGAYSIGTSSGIDVSAGILIVGNGANISTMTPTGFQSANLTLSGSLDSDGGYLYSDGAGDLTAVSVTGDGAGLYDLNAGALTGGVAASGVLPSTVAYTSSTQTFTGSDIFQNTASTFTLVQDEVLIGTSTTPGVYSEIISPSGAVTVNSSATFKSSSLGVNGVGYSWPSSQGGASTYLVNNGSGGLSWGSGGSGTVQISSWVVVGSSETKNTSFAGCIATATFTSAGANPGATSVSFVGNSFTNDGEAEVEYWILLNGAFINGSSATHALYAIRSPSDSTTGMNWTLPIFNSIPAGGDSICLGIGGSSSSDEAEVGGSASNIINTYFGYLGQ